MLSWIAANAANIVIVAVLVIVVSLIIRGMIKGRIRTCSDCGSCGGEDGCSACQFAGNCHKEN